MTTRTDAPALASTLPEWVTAALALGTLTAPAPDAPPAPVAPALAIESPTLPADITATDAPALAPVVAPKGKRPRKGKAPALVTAPDVPALVECPALECHSLPALASDFDADTFSLSVDASE